MSLKNVLECNYNNMALKGYDEKCKEPEHLLCPITKRMYKDPVIVVATGQTYEMKAITNHLENTANDPVTRETIIGTKPILQINWGIRKAVEFWLKEHPYKIPSGWDTRDIIPPALLKLKAEKLEENVLATIIYDIVSHNSEELKMDVSDITKYVKDAYSNIYEVYEDLKIDVEKAIFLLVEEDKAMKIGQTVKLFK